LDQDPAVTLLVVEDEERVASFVEKGLRAHGYAVEWVQTGQDALRRMIQPGISLVVLDLGLPDLDGLEVLKALRGSGSAVPVLVLTARGRVDDRVRGLNLGADDYMGKPFAFEELLARVRANLRLRATSPPGVLEVGGLRIDPLRHEVTTVRGTVSLSAREFALLKVFADHPGQVLSRQELLSMAWDINFDPQTNPVDVYVGYLRRKLGERTIATARGEGYCLLVQHQASSHMADEPGTADGP
jgi:DNA-binding response OmpR family regulator